jgi:ssDNA-binding Zn-finger/Zn-ribbon topoisomerase 1
MRLPKINYKDPPEVQVKMKRDWERETFGITIGEVCPLCGKGKTRGMATSRGMFIGCTKYPKCTFRATSNEKYNE